MKKEEILEKSRKTGIDEREIHVSERALTVGGLAVTISIGIFMVIRAINSLQIFDLLSILLAYLAVNYAYKFYQIRKIRWLFFSILLGLGTIFYGALYILNLGR